jgi:hypothetical protein
VTRATKKPSGLIVYAKRGMTPTSAFGMPKTRPLNSAASWPAAHWLSVPGMARDAMFLPIVRRPQEIESFDPHKVETVGISCMCGKEAALKDCLVVWTA